MKTKSRIGTSPEQQAYLSLVTASEALLWDTTALFKAHGLSLPQYNVLRILRGAGPEGLTCQGIRTRMLTRVPDITRLLDRLEKSGYVTRARGAGPDRRVVMTQITRAGLDLLAKLDEPVLEHHRRQFARLTPADVEKLSELLTKLVDEPADTNQEAR